MKSKKRYASARQLNFVLVFLFLDLFVIFGLLRTSNASYTSTAIGDAAMEVALYAVRYTGMNEATGVTASDTTSDQTLDINLGDVKPGDTKYYKFKIYNTDENGTRSDTNVSYELKIIVTTNIDLEYSLYYNEHPESTNAANLLTSSQVSSGYERDDWGTWFRTYVVNERCMNYRADKIDEYTLKVVFPQNLKSSAYQDLVESIKVQLKTKQVLPGDPIESSCGNPA